MRRAKAHKSLHSLKKSMAKTPENKTDPLNLGNAYPSTATQMTPAPNAHEGSYRPDGAGGEMSAGGPSLDAALDPSAMSM